MTQLKDTKIVYIGHRKRVGKDTAALLLEQHLINLGLTVKIMSFAKPIKDITANIFDVTVEDVDIMKDDQCFVIKAKIKLINGLGSILGIPTLTLGRNALLGIGSSIRNNLSFNPFLDIIRNTVEEGEFDIIIVSDFRLEEEYFKSGVTVRIDRDTNIKPSPKDIDYTLRDFDFDYTVDNNSDIQSLNDKMYELRSYILNESVTKNKVKLVTNIVVDLKDFAFTKENLSMTLDNLKTLEGNQVLITLVYDNTIEDMVDEIMIYTKLNSKKFISHTRSTYIDSVKLSALSDMYNIIYVSDTIIKGFGYYKACRFLTPLEIKDIKVYVNGYKRTYSA